MDNAIILQILTNTKARINSGWCQNYWAKDEKGHCCSYENPNACSFCINGAVLKSRTSPDIDVYDVFRHIRRAGNIPSMGIPLWNDNPNRTKEEVIALLDKAIQDVNIPLPEEVLDTN